MNALKASRNAASLSELGVAERPLPPFCGLLWTLTLPGLGLVALEGPSVGLLVLDLLLLLAWLLLGNLDL